ncbi:SMI1/KNR4 family protein [Bacteroidia bacterium]|nr:SMI1/KNR4 family protein [Bacteroidia bacterium]GHT28510.1 SMI1/KNR4 family protein [Bacteroidia bacterium]
MNYGFLINYKVGSVSSDNELANIFYPIQRDNIELAEEKLGYKLPLDLKNFYQEIGYGFFHREQGSINRLLSPLQVAQINLKEGIYEADPDLDVYDDIYKNEKILFFEVNEGLYLAIDKENHNGNSSVYLFDKKISDSLKAFIKEFTNNPDLINEIM